MKFTHSHIAGIAILLIPSLLILGGVYAAYPHINPGPSLSTLNQTSLQYKTAQYSGVGFIHIGEADSACRSNHPCQFEAAGNVLYYYTPINSQSVNYRLIFPTSVTLQLNDGSKVLVAGMLVTPSQWPTNLFTSSYVFSGDIIVETISPQS